MECIICKDKGDEPLQNNSACECKYKYHNSCWTYYSNTMPNIKCLICRKTINKKATVVKCESPLIVTQRVNITPYTLQNYSLNQNESNNTIIDSGYYALPATNNINHVIEIRDNASVSALKKKEKVLECIVLLTCILIIIVIIIIVIFQNYD
jgi:hypothetical protein